MNHLSQYPVIGALIFILVVVVPIALAVSKKKKQDNINKADSQ
jgi:hypothetical protein